MLKKWLLTFLLVVSPLQAAVVELIELGDFEEAEKLLLQELATTTKHEKSIELRTLYGDVWFYRRQFGQAKAQYDQALKLAEKINNKALQAEQMKNIAIVFSELKHYGKALKWQELAKSKLDHQLTNYTGMSVLLSQAVIFNQVGAPELAMETLAEAQNIAYQLSNHAALNNSYLRLAHFHLKKQAFLAAESRLKKVDLNSFSNMDDLLWYYLMRLEVALNLNALVEAANVLEQFELVVTGAAYRNDPRIKSLATHLQIKQGDFDQANELINSLEQDKALSSWQIKFLKAQGFKAQNQHLTAFDLYQEAVNLFTAQYVKAQQKGLYVELPMSLLKQTISAALDVGYADFEQIFNWISWLYVAKQPKFSNQFMAEYSHSNEGADLGFSEVVADVMQGPSALEHNTGLNLSALQQALKADEGLVFFVGINNQLLALMVGQTSAELIELHHDLKSVNEQVSQLLNSLSHNDDWLSLSQQLEQQLIHPLRAYGLDGFKKLHVIPDENLRFLPFDVLLDGQGEMMLDKHIISFHTIHSLPQFVADRNESHGLKVLQDPPQADRLSFVGAMSAMADVPSYWRTAYRNLDFKNQPFKGVEKEHALIKSMGLAGKVLLNQAATETTTVDLIKQETGVLHVASHGFDNPVAPAFSSLVLTASEQDDGLLQAREVAKLKSRLSLVVLASCSSAKGGLQGRYGYQLGLSEAFLQAGAKAVVGTLWDVKDEKTFQFMQWFYRFMTEVGQPLLALNLAKQQAIDEHWLAADWSAFIILGDGTVQLDLTAENLQKNGLKQINLKLISLVALLLLVTGYMNKSLKPKR